MVILWFYLGRRVKSVFSLDSSDAMESETAEDVTGGLPIATGDGDNDDDDDDAPH